jgi:predicted Zn-dependent peptidase
MKTKIYLLITLFLVSVGVNAQIDRSKQPKPGPAPKISLEKPGEFQLSNGITVLVVENHKLPRVSYTLTIDNKPITEGNKAGVSGLLGAMLGNGTTSIPKDEFNEEIDFLGARLGFGSSGAFASSLSKYSDRIIELMADAAINPLLVEEEFNKEKKKAIEGLKSNDKSVSAAAGRVGGALSYGIEHPRGEFSTEETLNNVTFNDVKEFYKKHFNPNSAYIVVVGDVDFKTVKKQIKKHFGSWVRSVDIEVLIPSPKSNVQYTQINFVDMPNAVQSNISLTNNVDLKMKDADYHSVLIANKILGGGFNSYLNMNLREEHGYTYGARSSVGTSRYNASRFSAGASVRNEVTDSAVVQTLKEIKRIKTEPVEADALKNAKAKYVGDFVLALERPQTIARYALNIKLNDLPEDFYETYLEKINAVSADDVSRVANKYFKTENARIVVVGKGSDVLANLEKTGIPIKYFDKYATSVEKPVFSKPIPSGVTAQSVMDSYLKAIGGKDKVETVNTVLTLADVTIEGAPFKPTAVIKAMAPNKLSMEMTVEGFGTVMKQKFDGKSGYNEQQGVKKILDEKEISEKQAKKALFPELDYSTSTLTLESVTTIDGEDVYKIKSVDEAKKTSIRYYSVETGLLKRVEESTEVQGQPTNTIIDYGNYSEVNGVHFPYSQKITQGPQIILLNITNIKVNEGVSDADFN